MLRFREFSDVSVVTDPEVLDTVGIPDAAALWAAKQEQIARKAAEQNRSYPHGNRAFGGKRTFRLPFYVDKIDEMACKGCRELWVYAPMPEKVESFAPLLLANRSVLLSEDFMLPMMHHCGFEKVFAKAKPGLPLGEMIDFSAYDKNFGRLTDKEERLRIALSRLLYPYELSAEAKKTYEAEVKKRFRPAMKLLITGLFDRYGYPSPHAAEVAGLKSMDIYLREELVKEASASELAHYVRLILRGDCRQRRPDHRARISYHRSFHRMFDHRRFFDENEISHLSADVAAEFLVEEYLGADIGEESGTGSKTAFLKRRMIFDLILRDYKTVSWHTAFAWLSRHPDQITEENRLLFERDKHPQRPPLKGEKETAVYQNFCPEEDENPDSPYLDVLRDSFLTAFSEENQSPEEWRDKALAFMEDGSGMRKGGGGKFSFAGKGSDEVKTEEALLVKREGYDYRDFLKQFMTLKEDRILDLDSFDPVYYTYGLREYEDMPLIEPLETKEMMRLQELVIVIDTSGSCSGRLVRFFLEETWSVFSAQENFFDHFSVRILQCDHIVKEDKEITRLADVDEYMKNLRIRGGGTTDFRAAFEYIKKLKAEGKQRHLKGILYFTDGFGTFPKYAPPEKCAFIFLKNRFAQVEVPKWAQKLLLPLPEGADWVPEYTGAFTMNI